MIEINYEEIDQEIRDLVRELNNITGIETTCSCCGHGKEPCRIWLKIDCIATLNEFCVDILNPFYGWHFIVENNISRKQPYISACLCSTKSNYLAVTDEINQLVGKIRSYYCD